MVDVPTLTDGAVTLRAHAAADLQRSWEQCQDPESIRWTTVPVPYSHADAAHGTDTDAYASRCNAHSHSHSHAYSYTYAARRR